MAMFVRVAETVEQREHESMQEFVTRLEKAAIKRSLQNLMTFPCVNILAGRGKLQLHGAYFGVAEGSLAVLDQETGQFHSATELAAS
jgi:carbonic anhydrase